MTVVLGFDTATAATAVAVVRSGSQTIELRHEPAAGERPGHATRLLGLVDEVLRAAAIELEAVDQIAVGVGPGSFTGLRIGIATARALAQGSGRPLSGVSSLLALAAGAAHDGPVMAVIDARRGEAFAALYERLTARVGPRAMRPEELAEHVSGAPGPLLAVGDGALRFRAELEAAGARVPAENDPSHGISARQICRLAAEGRAAVTGPAGGGGVTPDYQRRPDAEIARNR
ncbi:MAG TPA: tRNA (adenosine(37)-N6)-threonylcarbamoyltransferase complex dimerization subunit type 1 TsaB [Solirubrobacteraceae bacterium]|nr:tRNA (adenosine(37)-N6)-threonylcarbamoyltransferase complex dimerization subunit type 1 TsaB [Solirubrobacteraceae bacterium]